MKTGFRKRHRLLSGKSAQCVFDVLLGIIAPFLCLFFDPIVFTRHGEMGDGFLSSLRLLCYVEIVLSAVALSYYLITRRGSPFLAGVLLGGSVFAFMIGLVMLPLTIIGLEIAIGVFGLTPFITSFVFFRNARRCWNDCRIQRSSPWRLSVLTLGTVLVLGIPAGLQWSASKVSREEMLKNEWRSYTTKF